MKTRRDGCHKWLTEQNRSIWGYKRVFNTDSEKLGCSVQKLGLRGFIAEPPIYPNSLGWLLVYGPPLGMMGFYLMAYKFKRGWFLYNKKKIWAQIGSFNLDDFEDMRDLPDEEEIQVQDEADAAEKLDAAGSMNAALDEIVERKKEEMPKPTATSKTTAAEPEKPKAELTKLEKILRQVDSHD